MSYTDYTDLDRQHEIIKLREENKILKERLNEIANQAFKAENLLKEIMRDLRNDL